MRAGIDKYYLFLFVALVPWIFFSTSLTGGAVAIISQKDMVKKIYFPRIVLPVAHVTGCFVNMLLCFIVVLAVVIFSGVGVNPAALCCMPIIMLVEYILALGFAFISSSVTVYFRDMEHILGILSMAWMYLTPIMYSPDMVPEKARWIFSINPMTHIIVAYRDILYYRQIPKAETLASAFVLGMLFLIIGFAVFTKLEKHFVEEL